MTHDTISTLILIAVYVGGVLAVMVFGKLDGKLDDKAKAFAIFWPVALCFALAMLVISAVDKVATSLAEKIAVTITRMRGQP